MSFDREISGHDPRDQLKRELTRFDSTPLVVACVIGAGIFFTPGRVAELLPSPHWILAAWLFGAILSLAGALANAELGAMFPRAGGDYVYLREGIHPVAGFLVGWLSFIAIYAGTVAALAAVLAEVGQLARAETLLKRALSVEGDFPGKAAAKAALRRLQP